MTRSASGIARTLVRAADRLTVRGQIGLLVAVALALQSLLVPAHASRMLAAATLGGVETIATLCLPVGLQSDRTTKAPGDPQVPLSPDLDKCWICQHQSHVSALPVPMSGPLPTASQPVIAATAAAAEPLSTTWQRGRPEPRAPPEIR